MFVHKVFWSVMPDLRSLPRTRYGGIQRPSKTLDSGVRRNDIFLLEPFLIDRVLLYAGTKMATKEEELIERLMREDEEFSRTKQAHSQLAKQLEELEKKSFLSPQDEMEIKILKKKKLALKDQMEKILVKYR